MHPVSSMASLSQQPLDHYEAILCDLDGCLISGAHVYEGAREFVRRNRDRLWIVSNNSSDTAETLAERLAGLGFDIDARHIVLAGEQTLRRLARSAPGARVAVYADAPLAELAVALGLTLDTDAPQVTVLARQTRFDLGCLTRLARQVDAGAALHVTNLDRTHPGPDGEPVPETGALLAALRTCCPDIAFRSLGKPSAELLDIVLDDAGVDAGRAVFIGDNPDTDGLAAQAAGMAFLRIEQSAPKPAATASIGKPATENGRASC